MQDTLNQTRHQMVREWIHKRDGIVEPYIFIVL